MSRRSPTKSSWPVIALAGLGLSALCLSVLGLLAGCSDRPVVPGGPSSGSDELRTWVTAVVECLHESGWGDASVSPDGSGIELDNLPAAQHAAFASARAACEEEAGPQPNAARLTREDVEALYVKLLAARECLSGLGYAISDPPSKAEFVDSYFTDRGPWSPYTELPELSPEELARVNEVCPQPR